MNDKLDELHLIYKMIGNYGFCTVQELLESYDKYKNIVDEINIWIKREKKKKPMLWLRYLMLKEFQDKIKKLEKGTK